MDFFSFNTLDILLCSPLAWLLKKSDVIIILAACMRCGVLVPQPGIEPNPDTESTQS